MNFDLLSACVPQMRLENTKAGRKGNLNVATEVSSSELQFWYTWSWYLIITSNIYMAFRSSKSHRHFIWLKCERQKETPWSSIRCLVTHNAILMLLCAWLLQIACYINSWRGMLEIWSHLRFCYDPHDFPLLPAVLQEPYELPRGHCLENWGRYARNEVEKLGRVHNFWD